MATTQLILEPVADFIREEHGLLIGGEEVPARSGKRFDVVDPATGEVISTVPQAEPQDVDDAVASARAAFPGWRDTPPAERAELLWRLGAAIADLADEFAQIEALDNGKPTGEAHLVDVPLCSALF